MKINCSPHRLPDPVGKCLGTLGFLFFCAASSRAAEIPAKTSSTPVRDLRVVGGAVVDLAPVHAWWRTHEGERPLPHWKKIEVTQFKDQLMGADHCLAKKEGGESVEIIVLNLPPALKTALSQLAQQETNIAALRAQIEGEEREEREVSATARASNRRARAVLNREVKTEQGTIRVKKDQLSKLEADHEASLHKRADQMTVFAMFTGKVFNKMEVWDCGRRKL